MVLDHKFDCVTQVKLQKQYVGFFIDWNTTAILRNILFIESKQKSDLTSKLNKVRKIRLLNKF